MTNRSAGRRSGAAATSASDTVSTAGGFHAARAGREAADAPCRWDSGRRHASHAAGDSAGRRGAADGGRESRGRGIRVSSPGRVSAMTARRTAPGVGQSAAGDGATGAGGLGGAAAPELVTSTGGAGGAGGGTPGCKASATRREGTGYEWDREEASSRRSGELPRGVANAMSACRPCEGAPSAWGDRRSANPQGTSGPERAARGTRVNGGERPRERGGRGRP